MFPTTSNEFFRDPSYFPFRNENIHDLSIIIPTNEQLYHNYDYTPNSMPMVSCSMNDYLDDCSVLYSSLSTPTNRKESVVNTVKIYINPFFKTRSSNQSTESSIDNELERISSLSSRSLSHSSSTNQEIKISPNNKSQRRAFRKSQRKQLIQEKELIFKRKSLLLSEKFQQCHLLSDHKSDSLRDLYEQYSSENSYQQWKPLSLHECFELCQYALDKHNRK
ncbi:hypothetical protein I4U23_008983 [Adineta vaga]|nr:hypothetical protein I4U23_008983 [Adineta vaga]